MKNAYIIGYEILYFRSVQMLKNVCNWNEKAKLCDLMCCIAYDMIMKGDY
jgi:hypothetical protein